MMRLSGPQNVTVPDNYRYTFQDGTVIRQSVYSDWLNKIRDHYEWNGIPRPDNYVALAEDQLCHLLPPGWCKYDDGTDAWGVVDTRLGMGDLFRGMEVLTRIVLHPDPLVDQAEAERRAKICSGCPVNAHIEGCLPCMKIPDVVASIKGARTTEADQFLKNCLVCKCVNSAAVWIKEEVLAKGITPTQHQQYQAFDHCWRKDIQPA